MKKERTFKHTKKVMLSTIVSMVIFCIVIFVLMGKYLTQESSNTMSEIGTLYMSEMMEK